MQSLPLSRRDRTVPWEDFLSVFECEDVSLDRTIDHRLYSSSFPNSHYQSVLHCPRWYYSPGFLTIPPTNIDCNSLADFSWGNGCKCPRDGLAPPILSSTVPPLSSGSFRLLEIGQEFANRRTNRTLISPDKWIIAISLWRRFFSFSSSLLLNQLLWFWESYENRAVILLRSLLRWSRESNFYINFNFDVQLNLYLYLYMNSSLRIVQRSRSLIDLEKFVIGSLVDPWLIRWWMRVDASKIEMSLLLFVNRERQDGSWSVKVG